eukprot:6168786-Amphidinium_carterae.1
MMNRTLLAKPFLQVVPTLCQCKFMCVTQQCEQESGTRKSHFKCHAREPTTWRRWPARCGASAALLRKNVLHNAAGMVYRGTHTLKLQDETMCKITEQPLRKSDSNTMKRNHGGSSQCQETFTRQHGSTTLKPRMLLLCNRRQVGSSTYPSNTARLPSPQVPCSAYNQQCNTDEALYVQNVLCVPLCVACSPVKDRVYSVTGCARTATPVRPHLLHRNQHNEGGIHL